MILKLTDRNHYPVLIGTESIICVHETHNELGPQWTEIESRHAMVTHTYVLETIDEIYTMITSKI